MTENATASEHWRSAEEQRTDVITPVAVAALHGLLDAAGTPPQLGETLPALWHWLAFLPTSAQRELGTDGHPSADGLLPPISGARRMYAGAQIEFNTLARVGEPIDRRSVVSAVSSKKGRHGPLTFVTVTHTYASNGATLFVERQDIVYVGGPSQDSSRRVVGDGVTEVVWDWQLPIPTSPTALFRFSALTYNAHRIHYDHPYATGVEGYPGLVVHGPLQAIALAELLRRFLPHRRMARFEFRALKPAFADNRLTAFGSLTGETEAELAAIGDDGTTMAARSVLIDGVEPSS
jgi:3-methylfumaryl-CoA hydratase